MTFCRDTVVIGASSGGVQALRQLLARLPFDLAAAVFIVQHQSAVSGRLVSVLDAATKLPVVAVDGEQKIHAGRGHVAPPDVHMVLSAGKVLSTRGARENRARPSITGHAFSARTLLERQAEELEQSLWAEARQFLISLRITRPEADADGTERS